MTTTFDEPDEQKSLDVCYSILPPDEAMAIWDKCPLPATDESKFRSRRDEDDDDESEIYIA